MNEENRETKQEEPKVEPLSELESGKEEVKTEEVKTEEPEQEEVKEEDAIMNADALKKFKGDVGKLAKSYVELEKKMSSRKPAKDMTDSEILEFNKEFYGELSKAKSSLEDEMAEISEKVAEDYGIATKLTDAVAASVFKTVASKMTNANISAANKLLGDAEVRQAVVTAVKAKGAEYSSDFNTRLTSGKVSAQELNLLAEQGKVSVEAELGLEGDADEHSFDSAEKELNHILEKEAHIWCNENHPEYFAVNQKIGKLKRKLGI